MDNIFEVKPDRLVYGGDAMGRLQDGRAVFVPFALPGELVRIRLVEEKPRFARGELVEVLEPSPQRVVPRCVHFGICGGCHYQHMEYAAQVEAKAAILKEQLERIGGLQQIPEIQKNASPEAWYYRNHIQFHLTPEGRLGYQKAHSNQTFAIRECHLPEPAINRTWPQLDIEPLPSLERVNLRVGADEELLLVLESSDPEPLEFDIEDLTISVVHAAPTGSIVLAGNDHILMKVYDRYFKVSATSFFQVNTGQAHRMVQFLVENLELDEQMTILDVYCGVGLFSAFLAPKVEQLVGIELSPQACEDFTANLDEYENVSLYEAAAEDVLASVQFTPDVIVVDPPREGLGVKAVDGILRQEASTLVYFSCDPATLARDAKRLTAGGYRLKKLALFDMFPQTYHMESVALLSRS